MPKLPRYHVAILRLERERAFRREVTAHIVLITIFIGLLLMVLGVI